ncbi:FliM/FliN family flagellar motor switch protein [Pseudomonas sp. BJa5]|uniref:FliM/FliN family flagellar motor switch protein n=1 Tax=Pseudomonas sp. BJa5 TaxID=2936270 RepID=UPI002559E676|nr:FliM/FliN family flagellar motor switch protein [Pseudomonas sp. BGr12]MDL2421173.1 FliM/FliN family flagellar motor switch protein [Pseudomonas sp. BGr12]
MSPLTLRQIHPQAALQRRLLRHDGQLQMSMLSADVDYLAFRARSPWGPWSGLVAAHGWLGHRLPQLSSLLLRPPCAEHIRQLFEVMPQPVPAPLPELAYEQLEAVEWVAGRAIPPWPLLMTDTRAGPLWLTELPAALPLPEPKPGRCSALSAGLELLLGLSQWRPRLPPATGDLLRILDFTPHWRLNGRFAGAFSFIEQGIHMTTAPSVSPDQALEPPMLAALPVTLEFSLPAVDLSFAELAASLEAGLLTLDAQAMHQVQVRANGQWLGCGELVRMGEQLALELHQVRDMPGDE